MTIKQTIIGGLAALTLAATVGSATPAFAEDLRKIQGIHGVDRGMICSACALDKNITLATELADKMARGCLEYYCQNGCCAGTIEIIQRDLYRQSPNNDLNTVCSAAIVTYKK